MDNNFNYDDVQNYDIPEEPKKDYGIISMIFGILSVVLGCGLPLPLGIVALVLANKSKKIEGSFKGFSLAGLITGIVGTTSGALQLVIGVIYAIFYVFILIVNIFANL